MYSAKPVDIEILAIKNSRRTHMNLFKCKIHSTVDSDVRSIDAPNLSVLHLKIVKYQFKWINCLNVERKYARNNGVSKEDIIFHLLMKKMMHWLLSVQHNLKD